MAEETKTEETPPVQPAVAPVTNAVFPPLFAKPVVVAPPTPVVVPITIDGIRKKAELKARFYAAYVGKLDHNPFYYLHPLEQIINALMQIDKPTQEQLQAASAAIDNIGEKDKEGKLLTPHKDNIKIAGIIQQQNIGFVAQALKAKTEPAPKAPFEVEGLGNLVKVTV